MLLREDRAAPEVEADLSMAALVALGFLAERVESPVMQVGLAAKLVLLE